MSNADAGEPDTQANPDAAVRLFEEFRQFAIDAVTHGVCEGMPYNRVPGACTRDFRSEPLADAFRAWKPE